MGNDLKCLECGNPVRRYKYFECYDTVKLNSNGCPKGEEDFDMPDKIPHDIKWRCVNCYTEYEADVIPLKRLLTLEERIFFYLCLEDIETVFLTSQENGDIPEGEKWSDKDYEDCLAYLKGNFTLEEWFSNVEYHVLEFIKEKNKGGV